MSDVSSNSDSSNDGAFGCLIFIRKKDGFSVPYDLVPGQITIGNADDADVRIKIPDERLQSIHCLIEIDENGIATLVNKAGDDTVRVNNKPLKKFKILQHNDMIDVIGKKFQYANQNLLNDEVQTEKPVPASLASRNRETINIFAQKRSPSKSPTFKVKSPSQRRRSRRSSSHKTSDLIVFDTPERSLGKKSHNRSSVHVTPKQVIYRPIVEDVSPATPPNSKETDDVFKTPVNTPALFEDIRKSVLQSRTRKSNKQIMSADVEKEANNKKRGRESSIGSQRSVKRRRMMYSADNNSEFEMLEESFESFNSEDWSEISQDQTDISPRFSDLTRTSFAYPISKCMSEPRLRQMKSVRLSRHNKTISVNFNGSAPPVNGSFLLANGIREDHLVESPRPSTSNLVLTSGSGSPLKNAIMNKSPQIRSPASTKLKRLKDSPKSNLGSPKLRNDSYISNNLSKFVGLKQLMRNRNDLSEVFGVNNVTSTPKICKSPKSDHTDVRGVKMTRNSPKNTLLDISGVDALFSSPILHKSQAEKSVSNTSRITRSPKSMICAEDMASLNTSTSTLKSLSVSTTKTSTGKRRSRTTSKTSQTLENEVLDLSAVKTPQVQVLHDSASRRSTKTPIAAGTPGNAEETAKSMSGSYVNVSLDTSKTKRLSRSPKKSDSAGSNLINLSKKSQVGESDELGVLETSEQKRLTRSSQYDLVDNVGSPKSIPSPRPNKSLQTSVLENNRSIVDHDYAKSFNEASSTAQMADSTECRNFETSATRRSTRTPVSNQHSDETVYVSAAKKSLAMTPEIIELDDESRASVDDVQYVGESRESVSASPDLNSPEVEVSNTSRLRRSVRTPSAYKLADISGSRKSRSVSQTYNSSTVIDLETSRKSMRSLSAYQYPDGQMTEVDLSETRVSRSSSRTSGTQNSDDDVFEIDVTHSSEPRKSSRPSTNSQYANDESVEIDALETSELRKSQNASGDDHCLDYDDDTRVSSSRSSVRTPNSISCIDEDLMHTTGRRTRTPKAGYKKASSTPKMPNSSRLDTSSISRTSMSTYRRLTKTPGSSRKSITTSQMLLDESGIGETSAFRRLTREADTNHTDRNSQLFAYPLSDSLESSTSTRVSRSDSRRQSKTPMASFSSWLSSSDLLETNSSRRASRTTGGKTYLNEENISSSNISISDSKLRDSAAVNILNDSASETVTETSNGNTLPEDQMAKLSSPRPSTRLSKTPSTEKSLSSSQILDSSKSSTLEPRSLRISKRASSENQSVGAGNTFDSNMSKRSLTSTVDEHFEGDASGARNSVSKSVTELSGGNIHPEDQILNVSRASTRLTKTPDAQKSLSASQILDSSKNGALEPRSSRTSKRISSGNQYVSDDYIVHRQSNSAPKSLNSSALNTLESSISKRSLAPTVDELFEGDEMNVTDSRNSTSTSVLETSSGNIHPENQVTNVSYSRASISQTKTPSAEKSFSTSQILDSSKNGTSEPRSSRTSKRISTENQGVGDDSRDYNDPRKSSSTPKLLNSSTLNTRESRMSKRSLTSTDERFEGDEMNVANPRNSISSTIKTPGSPKKSISQSQIDSPVRTDADTDVTLEIGAQENNDPKNRTRTPQSVEYKDVMNVSSRSRRQTRTPSGSVYLEDEVLSISMTRKTASRITSDSVANECIMSGSPQDTESYFAFEVSKSPQNDLSNLSGVKRLMKTPRSVKSPKNDLTHVVGVKKLLATPKVAKSPKNDLSDIRGVKKLLKTPRAPKSPKNDLSNIHGVKKLLQTPKAPKSPKNDLTDIQGVKKLLQTPKAPKSPKNDLTNIGGLKKLMTTPKMQNSPKNDLTNVAGVKKLMSTPKQPKSPKNDLSTIVPLKKLMSTPKPTKEPFNDLSNVSGVKDLFPDNQEEDMFSSVFNKKRLRTYSGKLSTSRMEEKSVTEEDSVMVYSHKNELVEEWMKQQDLVMSMENLDEAALQTSTKAGSKKQAKKTGKSKTSELEEVSDIPVSLEKEKTRKRQKNDANVEDCTTDLAEKVPGKRTRGKKNDAQESNIDEKSEAIEGKKQDNKSVKPASRSRGKKKTEIEENETAVEEKPIKATRGRKKIVEESNSDETESKKPANAEKTDMEVSAVNVKTTRKGRSKKDQTVETVEVSEEKQKTDTEMSATNEKPTRKGRSNKSQAVDAEKQQIATVLRSNEDDIQESNKKEETTTEQVKLVQTTEVQPRRGRAKIVDNVQEETEVKGTAVRRGRNKKAVEAAQEELKEVKESPAVRRNGRNKKAAEHDDDDSKDIKEPVGPTRRGQAKKTVKFTEDDSKIAKESPAPVRKGRSKKVVDADKDDVEEVKEAPAPVRRGRNKKASEADEDDLKEVHELPSPTRKRRNNKTNDDEEVDVKKIEESPAVTRGGRNKKATEVIEVSKEIHESPAPVKRGRNKKASVADEDDVTELKELPAPTRKGRNKKIAATDEEEPNKDVKDPPKRSRTKKVVEDIKDDTDVKESPAVKRLRGKAAIEDDAEEENKRTRRARGAYDKYGGEFLSESPLNKKRIRGKKQQ